VDILVANVEIGRELAADDERTASTGRRRTSRDR
jgi:hypothetical protein